MDIECHNIDGIVKLKPGCYWGRWSGFNVYTFTMSGDIADRKNWIDLPTETGLKGTCYCMVKVLENKKALIII